MYLGKESVFKQHLSVMALLFFAMFFSSCATIISGTTAKIYLDGDVGEPLTVVTTKGEYQDLSLPATIKVKRHGIDGQHIQISSDSYAFSDIILRKSFNPWAILDAFSEVSLVADLLTNAVSKPAQDSFFIIRCSSFTGRLAASGRLAAVGKSGRST